MTAIPPKAEVTRQAWRVGFSPGWIIRATRPSRSSIFAWPVHCGVPRVPATRQRSLRKPASQIRSEAQRPCRATARLRASRKRTGLIERLPGVVAIGVRDGSITNRDGFRRCNRYDWGAIAGEGDNWRIRSRRDKCADRFGGILQLIRLWVLFVERPSASAARASCPPAPASVYAGLIFQSAYYHPFSTLLKHSIICTGIGAALLPVLLFAA